MEPRFLGWAVVAFALILRLLWLGLKPPHFDEGVNGWFVDQMIRNGYYAYDPTNYHGPFHFYVLFLFERLFGHNIWALRMPLVLVNTATVWLVLQFRRWLPWRACVIAALAFAVSPGMLFFSRYAIHEAWLVFGMMLAFWGFMELWMTPAFAAREKGLCPRGLWAAAMGATLMLLNKETHLIHFVAFGLTIPTLWGLEKLIPSEEHIRPAPRQWAWSTLTGAALACLLLLAFFFSGGFLDPAPWKEQAANFFRAFNVWTDTGLSDTHEKPWYYWLQLMLRYEWPALLGLLWSVRALWPGMNLAARFLAIYGCGTLVGYSLVPYKTPWCIIAIIWPFLLLFGVAADALRKRWWAALVVLGVSFVAAVDLNYLHPTEEERGSKLKLPSYIYVQTTNDYFKLERPFKALLARDPAAAHLPMHVILSSYYPLPWTFGGCTKVGYTEKGIPSNVDAAILVVENDRIEQVEQKLRETYFVEPFQLRDGMDGAQLYFNAAHFAPLFPGRKPEFP